MLSIIRTLLIAAAIAGLVGLVVALVRLPPEGRNHSSAEPSGVVEHPNDRAAPLERSDPPARTTATETAATVPIAVPSSSPSADIEDLKGIEGETDPNRANWRVLRYSLQEFRKLGQVEPGSRAGALICRAVVTVLQLRGRGAEPDSTYAPRDGEHYVISKGRGYLWYEGEFPEYDAWKRHTFGMSRFEDALMRDPSNAGERPVFDPVNFALIEARAVDAIEMLEERYGFH